MQASETLAGKTALVTGGAKRLGAATARALARRGVSVALHYQNSRAEAGELAEELRTENVNAWLLQADLSDTSASGQLMEDATQTCGPIDILINNASIFPEDTLCEFEPSSLFQNVTVNTLAPAMLGRALAANQRPAAIINLLDTMIADYDKKHVSYHLSKRMLYTLTRMMAIEFAPNVRVNAVAPGLVLPPEGKDIQYLKNLAHSNPLNTHGSAADVTNAILYLLDATFVTGQVIFIDGGRNLKGSMYG